MTRKRGCPDEWCWSCSCNGDLVPGTGKLFLCLSRGRLNGENNKLLFFLIKFIKLLIRLIRCFPWTHSDKDERRKRRFGKSEKSLYYNGTIIILRGRRCPYIYSSNFHCNKMRTELGTKLRSKDHTDRKTPCQTTQFCSPLMGLFHLISSMLNMFYKRHSSMETSLFLGSVS